MVKAEGVELLWKEEGEECLKREEKFIAGIPPNRREQLWQRLPYKQSIRDEKLLQQSDENATNYQPNCVIPQSNFRPKILNESASAR